MPRKSNTRSAAGAGSIRQRSDGSWEGRFIVGHDPGTGKPIRKSVYAKTQKDCKKKMVQAIAAVDTGSYKDPCKMTVGEWLDTWAETYLGGVKPRTAEIYKSDIKLYIKPALGALKLETLNTHTIQQFYNKLLKEGKKVAKKDENGKVMRKDGKTVYDLAPLSGKTVKNIHGAFHSALKQATLNGYIRFNPADACILPRTEKKEITPLDEIEAGTFIRAIQGHRFEEVFMVTLFTGMREGEVLGLTWDCIDFEKSIITINKQMQLHQEKELSGAYTLVPTKNSKARTITAAPFVMEYLRRRKIKQLEQRLQAGPLWTQSDLVFTDELGQHLTKPTVYRAFKKVVTSIGRPDARFHDLRHSYAVAAIRSGDDIKTVQSNLGHATAAFTLDVYGHVTDQMKQESASRMQAYYDTLTAKQA